jgi:hypothetical protein
MIRRSNATSQPTHKPVCALEPEGLVVEQDVAVGHPPVHASRVVAVGSLQLPSLIIAGGACRLPPQQSGEPVVSLRQE